MWSRYSTLKLVGKACRPLAARSKETALPGRTARSARRCNATAAAVSGNVTVYTVYTRLNHPRSNPLLEERAQHASKHPGATTS